MTDRKAASPNSLPPPQVFYLNTPRALLLLTLAYLQGETGDRREWLIDHIEAYLERTKPLSEDAS